MSKQPLNASLPRTIGKITGVLLNFMPLAGLLWLKWEAREIFLYYSLELTVYSICMLPQLVIFARKTGLEEGKSAFGIVLTVFFLFLYHAVMFFLFQSFLVHSAFAASAGEGAYVPGAALIEFARNNIMFILMIVVEYAFGFYIAYMRNREHEILSCDYFALEIYFAPMLLIVGVGIVYGLSAALRLTGVWHACVVITVVTAVKSFLYFTQTAARLQELQEFHARK